MQAQQVMPNLNNNGFGMPPPLELNKTSSQYQYSSKKARTQNWFTKFRANKKLDTEMLLKGYSMRKESKSFLITIKNVTGIPQKDLFQSQGQDKFLPAQGAKFYLEYYMTLFNKDIGLVGTFYGRTYRSQSQPLRESANSWDSSQEEYVFFHTSYIEKSSFAVVECVIVKDFLGQKTYTSGGYVICNIFEFGGTTTVDLSKGSPRSIGQIGIDAVQSRAQKSQGKLTYEIRDFPSFDKIKSLIPQNCFCGFNDVIPGIQNDKLPNPRQGGNIGQVNLMLFPRATIYIHNLQMLTSIAFENRFENFLRKMKQEKNRTARGHYNQNQNDNVYISERRIMISANNTWMNITEDAHVSMGPPNEQGISISGGSLTIKNFVCHPLVALVFRIEYKAIIPTDKSNESFYFTIGWCCHLPTFNAAQELSDETIETDFELGPGESPSGDLIWDPNADDINYYTVKMKAQISTNAQPPNYVPPPLQGTRAPIGGGRRPLKENQPLSSMPLDLDPKHQAVIDDYQRKFKELEQRFQMKTKNDNELQQQIQYLEMQRLQEQSRGGPQSQNDHMYREEIRMLNLQKEQMANELVNMRGDMKQLMESLKEGMVRGGPGGFGQYQPNYADSFNQMQNIPFQQSSANQIAMIGNVFYNMLNMLGETEKDKRIIGLSDNLKKMVQQAKFDDLLAPKAPYVGMGHVNLLKTTDLPLTDQVNFIKLGMGDLLQHPTAQVTSSSFQKERLSIDVEAQDQLKACTISFKFLCFKTPWNGLENLPKRFYFQFKFFTFPSVITDKVKIKNHHEFDMQNADIRPGQPYYLQKEIGLHKIPQNIMKQQDPKNLDTMHDPNLLAVTFEIDPSISRLSNENNLLANYLYERFLTVDIFDGDSLFLYGTCKIPLYELLRQGRGCVVRAKECEMCDPDTGDFRGAIQLIMSNQGKMPSVVEQKQTLSDGSPVKSRIQPSQAEHQASGKPHKYKKVVKSKPMDLTKMQQTNNTQNLLATHTAGLSGNYNQTILSQMNQTQISQVSMQNADLRKKLRVDRVRKMTMGNVSSQTSVEDPSQPDWAKFKSLREIEMIRETKKDQILNRVLEDYVSGSEQMAVIPGQLEFLKLKVHNPFNQNEVFTVHINDPDDRVLSDGELKFVTDPAELRHWVALGKCARPVDYSLILNSGDIVLKPNDEIELLFKFMSYREASIDPTQVSSATIIKPRKIQIIILQSNKQPYTTLEVNIVPSSTPIDHTFRFYEPQTSHVSLKIPPFLQLNHPGLVAQLSHPTAQVSIDKQNGCISLEAKTEEAPVITEMLLFIYGDQFREKLLAACQIELYALDTMYTKIKAGVMSVQNLSLPAENPRSVMIHSNNPRMVFLPKRDLNKTFKIIPHSTNHIQICAKTYLPVQQKVQIHCTDVNTGELVYRWLLVVDADTPNVTKKHEVTVKCNHTNVQCLEFANKLNEKTVYEFVSSRPDFVIPKVEAITFEKRESKLVDLFFQAQPKYGIAEVYIFVNDIEYRVVECYQLKITYLP